MPRYKVNLDLYIVADDPEDVEFVLQGMADSFDYWTPHFSQRGAITELPEDEDE